MNVSSQRFIKNKGTQQPVLSAQDLSIGYKIGNKRKVIASELNLQLNKGTFACLLGANGSGKSTLLRTLAGVQPPLHGHVTMGQQNIATMDKMMLAKNLSLVLTDVVNFGSLSVYEILTLGRYPYTGWFGILTQSDKEIIRAAIDAVGIEKFLKERMHSLSDGERQKVMIARALVQDTPLIFLDEPTAHLDLPNRVEIMRLLRKMARTTGKCILLSTHELDLALQAADEIWMMLPDHSILTGTPEDLILEGAFEKAFSKEGFDFSKETGTFKLNYIRREIPVTLQGSGVNYFWTKRALEREGFSLSENAPIVISILDDNNLAWEITSDHFTLKLNSIKSVLDSLNTQDWQQFT